MNIVYEKATEKDAYSIRYIGVHSWKETYAGLVPDDYLDYRIEHIDDTIEKEKKIIQDKNNNIYIVKVDNKTVGFVSYGPPENNKYKDYGYVQALYLLKEYQGYGIGKELFKIALKGLKELGYTKMMLECMQGNKTKDFYKKYLGEIVNTIDYPLNNGSFSVKAEIILFDINKSLKEMKEYKTR